MGFREMRKKAGIGLNEAAAHFGVTKQSVNAWERGENRPNSDTVLEMSRYYRCTADELLRKEATEQNGEESGSHCDL